MGYVEDEEVTGREECKSKLWPVIGRPAASISGPSHPHLPKRSHIPVGTSLLVVRKPRSPRVQPATPDH